MSTQEGHSILDYDRSQYLVISAEEYVGTAWIEDERAVFDEAHTGQYTRGENGAAIKRLMQVMSMKIAPHIGNDGESYGNDYEWEVFDFVTCELRRFHCWGCRPHFYVLLDEDDDPNPPDGWRPILPPYEE